MNLKQEYIRITADLSTLRAKLMVVGRDWNEQESTQHHALTTRKEELYQEIVSTTMKRLEAAAPQKYDQIKNLPKMVGTDPDRRNLLLKVLFGFMDQESKVQS